MPDAQTLDARLRPVARAVRDALRPGPPPFPDDAPPDRAFPFRLAGLRLEVPRAILGPATWRALHDRTYERNELDLLPRLLRPTDTVLEVGAALGLVSARAAQLARRVVAVEANPDLLPVARRTHELNGVQVELRHAVVGHADGEATFHLHRDFWASSIAAPPGEEALTRPLRLPARALSGLLAEIRPEVLIVDVEGGEAAFFAGEALPGVRQVLVELHRWATGLAGIAKVFADLGAAGFAYDPDLSAGQVVTFARLDA